MKSRIITIILSCVLIICTNSYSQIVDDTVIIDKDAYINSNSSSTNYGNANELYVEKQTTPPSPHINRTLVEADLSAIPSNAIIVSAVLKLYCTNTLGSFSFYVERNLSSWSETGVTSNNQPSVSTSDQISIPYDSLNTSSSWHNLDVTSHVQKMINYPNDNYGWRIRLLDESIFSNYGADYRSSDYNSGSHSPEIEIQYILPVEVSGYVKHCSNGASDGAIDPVISNGVGSYSSYEWFKLESGNTYSQEQGTNFNNVDLENIDPGLYLLHVKDDSDYTGYNYFLVGEEGDTTTVELYSNNADTSSLFWEDSHLGDDNPDANQSTYPYICPTADDNISAERKTILKFNLDYGNLLEVQTAKLKLYSPGQPKHYRTFFSSNKSYVSLVTSEWEEEIVTWNSQPSFSTTIRDSIPETSSTGYVARDDTVDMMQFLEYWQENPDQNYGIVFSIADFPPSTWTMLRYGGADYTTSVADRPKLKLSYAVTPTGLSSSFDDTTGLGSIDITAPNGELPYTYLLSRDSLPPLDTIWQALKDSIPIDSSDFFQGDINSQNYSFENLLPDKYFVGVYDNNGALIFNESTIVSPSILIYDSTGIDLEEDTIKVQSGFSEGEVTLLLSLEKEENGGIDVEVVSLDGDFQIGFNNVKDEFPNYSRDYEFSVDVQNTGKVYLLKSDTIIDSTTVSVGDHLKLQKFESSVFFYKNNEEVNNASINTETQENWKVNLDLKSSLSKVSISHISGLLKKPKVKYQINNLECLETEGSVSITIPTNNYFGWNIQGYTIYDESNSVVASGNSTGTINLPAGIYSLSIDYSLGGFGPFTFYEEFVLYYPVYWQDVTDLTDLAPTLEIYPTTVLTEGSAKSINTTEFDKTNWIMFQPELTGINSSFGNGYSNIKFEDPTGSSPVELKVTGIGGWFAFKYLSIYKNGTYLSSHLLYGQEEVKVELEDVQDDIQNVNIYLDGNLIESFSPTNISGKNKIYIKQYKNLVKPGITNKLLNTRANFCYPKTTDFIAKTKPFKDGSYYMAHLGTLNFQYSGEYNQSELQYELKDEEGNVVSSGYDINIKGGSGVLKKNADNRYTIDLTSQTAGFYLLTITNVKGEEHYLRIRY